MTPERKKALLLITITLVIGIAIGALGIGLLHRQGRGGGRRGSEGGGREGFIKKITEVVHANPDQAARMRPYIEETMTRIDSLQVQSERKVHSVLDSLEIKLAPILDSSQLDALKAFHHRRRGHP